jgi:hypothetical protein
MVFFLRGFAVDPGIAAAVRAQADATMTACARKSIGSFPHHAATCAAALAAAEPW